MFGISKAFSIAETIISTAEGVMKALGKHPDPFGIAMASAIGVLGAGKVALIASQNPQSYDEGGVSTKKGIYYSGVPEAHIPLKSGAVPVKFIGGGSSGSVVNINLNNPVFQDLETQRAHMAMIAATVTKNLAPGVVSTNYMQDGVVRRTIRGGF
jgi:hypothetical protein